MTKKYTLSLYGNYYTCIFSHSTYVILDEVDMTKDQKKDLLVIGGFGMIFHIMGFIFFLFFSMDSLLECDPKADTYSLNHTYILQENVIQQWNLSEIRRAYVETQYPQGTPNETSGKSPTYRDVIILQDQHVPFTPHFSTDKEWPNQFVKDIEDLVSSTSIETHNNPKFIRHQYNIMPLWGGSI